MPLTKHLSIIKELETIDAAMHSALDADSRSLLDKASELEKWPLAQLVSIFERNTTENLVKRHQIIQTIESEPERFSKKGTVFGITGTPGAGKSSLIGAVCSDILEKAPEKTIAVLAIDPSSQDSGGALLGDRTRTHFPANDKRIFFRSQASHLDLGGMGKSTFHAIRLLRKLFDIVIIETVGIGQSEIEIQRLADHLILVMQPLAGDQVQFMKAGIMEIPDSFVINKCDEDELARKSLNLLKASLKLAKIHLHGERHSDEQVFLTSATKKRGITELADKFLSELSQAHEQHFQEQEQYFLGKWIQQAYGEFGLGLMEHFKAKGQQPEGTFEEKELAFKENIAGFLSKLT